MIHGITTKYIPLHRSTVHGNKTFSETDTQKVTSIYYYPHCIHGIPLFFGDAITIGISFSEKKSIKQYGATTTHQQSVLLSLQKKNPTTTTHQCNVFLTFHEYNIASILFSTKAHTAITTPRRAIGFSSSIPSVSSVSSTDGIDVFKTIIIITVLSIFLFFFLAKQKHQTLHYICI